MYYRDRDWRTFIRYEKTEQMQVKMLWIYWLDGEHFCDHQKQDFMEVNLKFAG